MFRQVGERLGRLDGLVNNAARFTRFDPLQITEAGLGFHSFGQPEGHVFLLPAGG